MFDYYAIVIVNMKLPEIDRFQKLQTGSQTVTTFRQGKICGKYAAECKWAIYSQWNNSIVSFS